MAAAQASLAHQHEEHHCPARKICCKLLDTVRLDTVRSRGEGSETREEAGEVDSKGSGVADH
jgi:hypothetical protein